MVTDGRVSAVHVFFPGRRTCEGISRSSAVCFCVRRTRTFRHPAGMSVCVVFVVARLSSPSGYQGRRLTYYGRSWSCFCVRRAWWSCHCSSYSETRLLTESSRFRGVRIFSPDSGVKFM
uniref:Uncharacterized protein n=1 Tax=Setaria italica TaxID=4555 RepID=K4ANX6_SETIT